MLPSIIDCPRGFSGFTGWSCCRRVTQDLRAHHESLERAFSAGRRTSWVLHLLSPRPPVALDGPAPLTQMKQVPVGTLNDMWNQEQPTLTIDASTLGSTPEDDLEIWARDQRVFVSSVMSEFPEERAALASAIRALGATPVLFEEFGGRDADPEAAYLEEVRSSDIYIGLLGRLYGRPIAGGFSATHAEYLEAEQTGLRISAWANAVDDREGHEQSFLIEIQTFHTTGNFSSTEQLVDGVSRRLREIGATDVSPWVKYDGVVFRSRRIRRGRREIQVEASLRNADVVRSLRGLAAGPFGGQELLLVAGDSVRRAVLAEVAEESTSSARTTLMLTFRDQGEPQPAPMSEVSFSEGGKTWSPGELTEAAVRRVLTGGEGGPDSYWGVIDDPFEKVRGSGIGEESIRPIARLLLTEALVGSGRAERILAFRLGPRRPTGQRSLYLRWRERRRYQNVDPEEREVRGDIEL